MKIEAYKTMTTWAQACSNEETAMNSPFIMAIKEPGSNKVTVSSSCTSHNITDLVQAIMNACVGMLKTSVKEGVDAEEAVQESIATICAMAMTKNFALEGLGKLKDLVEEMPDEFQELLARALFDKEEE